MLTLKRKTAEELERERLAKLADESILSEDDIKRIRAEALVRDDVQNVLERSRTPEHEKNMQILNSPFVVHLVGALLIGAIGTFLEANFSAHRADLEAARALNQKERDRLQEVADKDLAKQEQLHQKKLSILASFSQDFDTYGVVWFNLKSRQQWLAAKGNNPDRLRRSRAQMLQEYENLMKLYLTQPKPTSMIAQVESIFGPDVDAKAEKLGATVDKLENETNLDTSGMSNEKQQMKDVISAMGKEILSDLKPQAKGSVNLIDGSIQGGSQSFQ